MTGPEESHSSTRPISVAELLARNGTIGAPPVGGRRRRRRGNTEAVTVAELTGEHDVRGFVRQDRDQQVRIIAVQVDAPADHPAAFHANRGMAGRGARHACHPTVVLSGGVQKKLAARVPFASAAAEPLALHGRTRVLRDPGRLLAFLDRHARNMPRTALRYAIEHLDPETRWHYLHLRDGVGGGGQG